MSRSELAQSIDESTQGKVTHRQGDFNRKLGNKGAFEMQIKTLITAAYSRKGNTDHSLRMFLRSRDCRSCLNPVTWIDSRPNRLRPPGRAGL